VNVVLPAPVFDKNQGNIRRAEADVRAARAEVARKELELTSKLAAHFENYLNARNQVKQYQTQIMPAAQEAWRLTNTSYRQGETGYLSLLTVQRTYFRSNLAYLESIRALWESSIAIDGLLLTDSLQDASNTPRFTRPPTMPLPRSPFDGE
jgi:cobalt-zinc-cadmium efflux system outer membrane protein